MRIIAILTVRNEARVLDRCLRHLAGQGIETCVVDNDSTDGSREIAAAYLGRGVMRLERLPYPGSFELATILRNEERLASEIEADWFIHHDADEIREAPEPHANLAAGIAAADQAGYNAVHFDEFVFLPTADAEEAYEGTDYVARMEHYYFFEPGPLRRLNAWKHLPGIVPNLADTGGHRVAFEGLRAFPIPFVMRHYIALSRAHVIEKYSRPYSPTEVQGGWHGERARFDPARLRLPQRSRLKRKAPGIPWDRSEPWLRHEFFGEST